MHRPLLELRSQILSHDQKHRNVEFAKRQKGKRRAGTAWSRRLVPDNEHLERDVHLAFSCVSLKIIMKKKKAASFPATLWAPVPRRSCGGGGDGGGRRGEGREGAQQTERSVCVSARGRKKKKKHPPTLWCVLL